MNKNKIQFYLGLIIFVLVIVSISIFAKPQASGDLKVYFLDVGQGDASYIKTPSGEDILIDGGPDNSVLTELGKVMDFGDREISLVILSHPHADHLTGLIEVLNRYKVNEVWETGVEYPSATYTTWKNEISTKNIPDKFVKVGDSANFGEAKITILYPLSQIKNSKIDNLNNSSIVNRLEYRKFSVLYLGDAETEEQNKLATSASNNLFADVLKVAHHGSNNGTYEDSLKIVRPAIAVISVGKDNKFGHPTQSTINLLKQYGVRIYRTDQNGTVEIGSTGEGYYTIPSKN